MAVHALPCVQQPRKISRLPWYANASRFLYRNSADRYTHMHTHRLQVATTTTTTPGRKQKVAGPTAIVTGGSQGVGKALGEILAANGYNVVLAARQPERLQSAADGCQRRASRADSLSMAVPCDITQPSQVTSLAERVFDTFASVSLVVNNAGVCMRGPMDMCTLQDYQARH